MPVLPMLTRVWLSLRAEVFASPLETVGTVLGIANIILLVRRSIWNYPAGILSVSILGLCLLSHCPIFRYFAADIFHHRADCWPGWPGCVTASRMVNLS